MKWRKFALCVNICVVTLLAVSSVWGAKVAHAAFDTWEIIPTPNFGTAPNNYLRGVVSLSSTSTVAVGYHDISGGHATLIERWNGAQWSIVTSQDPGSGDNILYGVAGSSSKVVAVGYQKNSNSNQRTLVERSTDDGLTWSTASSPNPGTGSNVLRAVAGVPGASTYWAVGSYGPNASSPSQTLILRSLDAGATWSVVSSPNPGTSSELYGVTAVSGNDAWAVGAYYSSGVYHTLTLHWDGTTWVQRTSPDGGAYSNSLNAAAAIASNNVWTVGSYDNSIPHVLKSLGEKWDGSNWTIYDTQQEGTRDNELYGAAAMQSDWVWAVGYYDKPPHKTLTRKWNGTSWVGTGGPNQGTKDNVLKAVSVRPGSSISAGGESWAVGFYLSESSGVNQTLAMRYLNLGCCP